MDFSVDRKLHDDQDSAVIFRKVIGREISHGYSTNLYLCCRMDFASNVVQTDAPKFVDLGILAVNTLDEFGILSTPLPESEGRWMYPIGLRRIIFLARQKRLKRVKQGQTKAIAIKLILKFGGKIRTLGAKIFQ